LPAWSAVLELAGVGSAGGVAAAQVPGCGGGVEDARLRRLGGGVEQQVEGDLAGQGSGDGSVLKALKDGDIGAASTAPLRTARVEYAPNHRSHLGKEEGLAAARARDTNGEARNLSAPLEGCQFGLVNG